MKTIQRILLTGDDGYNSIGTRILVSILKDNYDLTIIGTKTQQTAVGGKLNVREGAGYVETTIDGIQTFCIDGSPGDAMEFARAQFGTGHFDLLLSGINMGENIGCGVVSSGTVSAMFRGFGWEVASYAMALSWATPPEFYFMKHDENEDITTYLEHPGKLAKKTLELCFKEKLWGARLLNINFPKQPSSKVRFVRFTQSLNNCYPPVTLQEDSRTLLYPFNAVEHAQRDPTYDVFALQLGYTTITPVVMDWTDEATYKKIQHTELTI